MVAINTDNKYKVLVLHPNCSMSWGQTRFVIAIIATFSLLIGLFWTVVGAWVVLPFAGIEIAAVSFGLYVVSRKLHQRHVIHISDSELRIEKGRKDAEQVMNLSRQSAGISVEQARHPWDAMKITLFDREQQIEIGDFLTKGEAESLLGALQDEGLKVRGDSHTCNRDF